MALLALATSILTCIYILLPKRGFIFSVSGVRMFEFKDDADEARRRLVYWLEGYYKDNQIRIDRLGRCYAVAALALALQVVLCVSRWQLPCHDRGTFDDRCRRLDWPHCGHLNWPHLRPI
jgi:hypothetical protein